MMIDYETGYLFTLTLCVRDAFGRPTGKKVTRSSDKASDIYDFWQKNRPSKKKRRRKTSGKLPSRKQAEKILKELNGDIQTGST